MVLSVFVSACSNNITTAGMGLETAPVMGNEYRLAPGDVVQVNVFRDPDLSGTYKIDRNGMITLPLLGQTPAEHATIDLLEEDLTNRLAEGYLVDPIVSIEITSYRPVFVSGEVKNPGSYTYDTSLNVFQAVTLAGGLTPRGKRNAYVIMRETHNGTKYYKANDTTPVYPGDSIYIEERLF
ncbi:MAG: polysaccharide biosynthesis/export family protein [Pseudomonadota bacterium]